MATEWIGTLKEQPVPSVYKWSLAGCVLSMALALLAVVDFRRGFLFTLIPDFGGYVSRTPYFVFSPSQVLMLALGIAGLVLSYRNLKRCETELSGVNLEKYVRGLTFILFALLVVDLFTYRGVAATRAAVAGKVGANWLQAFGVGGWLKPMALTVSYMLTVWHATFLGVLLAGLAQTVLPRYLKSFFARTGFWGSLFGALFALPQPFCSCCASVIAPSLVRQGASTSFSLAFVVGAPMLNLSTLILAAMLLPTPYAVTRILAGIVLTVLATYGVARLAKRWDVIGETVPSNRLVRWIERWVNAYTRTFHLDELVRNRRLDTPATFLPTWLYVSGRIALILVPILLLWSVVTAAVVQVLPAAFGNNLPSVVIAAVAGTLLMIPTWTEIPVALQMIQAGFYGPAATLMVVLPPVSLPCLLILGGCIARFRVAALLGLVIVVAGIIAGLMFL